MLLLRVAQLALNDLSPPSLVVSLLPPSRCVSALCLSLCLNSTECPTCFSPALLILQLELQTLTDLNLHGAVARAASPLYYSLCLSSLHLGRCLAFISLAVPQHCLNSASTVPHHHPQCQFAVCFCVRASRHHQGRHHHKQGKVSLCHINVCQVGRRVSKAQLT